MQIDVRGKSDVPCLGVLIKKFEPSTAMSSCTMVSKQQRSICNIIKLVRAERN
jgi:hypothetical protein